MESIDLNSKLEDVEAFLAKYELKYKIGIIGHIGHGILTFQENTVILPPVKPRFTEIESLPIESLPKPQNIIKYPAPLLYDDLASPNHYESRRDRRKAKREKQKRFL